MGDTGRVPALDGLRGTAIGLVLVGHVWNRGPTAYLAPYGVTLFFLLSGYLITGLLLAEIENTGTVRLGRFAVRRGARLLPAFAVMLVGVFTFAAATGLDVAAMWADAVPGVLYVADFVHSPGSQLGAFGHTWSLSVEEQFYAVWPVALWLLWKVAGRRGAVVALGLLAAYGLLRHGPLPSGTSLDTNVLYLAAGSLAAACGFRPSWPRPLAARPLVQLGGVSYALYLWHYPLLDMSGARTVAGRAAVVVVAAACAALSTRFVERPARRWARRRYAGSQLVRTCVIVPRSGLRSAPPTAPSRRSRTRLSLPARTRSQSGSPGQSGP